MTAKSQRLIFLHPSDELYGADRMLLEMLQAVDETFDVEVWLPNDLTHSPDELALCNTLERSGIAARHVALPIMRRAYRNPRGMVRLASQVAQLVRRLRAARPDVVYCTTSAALLGAPAARMARVPRVIAHFQEIWAGPEAHVLAVAARTCHTLLAVSEAVTSALPADLRRRTVIVVNATPEPQRVTSLEGRVGELRYVVASRWNGWKGHRTLFDAWGIADAPGHLTVLGGPPLSGESVDVPALVSALDRPDSVTVVGEVADPSIYIDDADVVIVPSDQPEPFGLVAIEAFARARPVIGSAVGGLLGIVDDGVNGWLYPPGDAVALSGVLASLDRDVVTGAGSLARKSYELAYTTERFGQRWRDAAFAGHGPGA